MLNIMLRTGEQMCCTTLDPEFHSEPLTHLLHCTEMTHRKCVAYPDHNY